jgi:hypothetical protein
MFDAGQRKFLLRKNFRRYGSEDRLRYRYQGDIFNVYSQRNTENALKHGFSNESVSGVLAAQNAHASKNVGNIFHEDIKAAYHFLFEEKLASEVSEALSASFGLQVGLLSEICAGGVTLELGAGCGLLAPLFFSHAKLSSSTFVVVEAIPQLLVLQQAVLKYFSVKTGDFIYCSSIEDYAGLRASSDKNIVLHVNAWDLDKLNLSLDVIVANNVLDQVTGSDFDEYLQAFKRLSKPDCKLSIWGGIEKGGVSNLYLFGFGTYHQNNIIEVLAEQYDLLDLSKEGSEYYALFECDKAPNGATSDRTIISIEKEEIKRHLPTADFLWLDDNSSFLEEYSDLFEECELVSASSSVSTNPLPCGIKRTHISDRKIREGEKILVCSYRWLGVKAYFEENGWRATVTKISDKVISMELTK